MHLLNTKHEWLNHGLPIVMHTYHVSHLEKTTILSIILDGYRVF